MAVKAEFFKKTFTFGFKARTSRGLMQKKDSWFIRIFRQDEPHVVGIGEAGPLPGLSRDAVPEFEDVLALVVKRINETGGLKPGDIKTVVPAGFSSITFAVESALFDLLNGGRRIVFDNSFVSGAPLPINGLVWMGDMDFMMTQINQKISQGFRCIKLKVGGLDFERECDVIDYIRKRYYREDIEIRLDANGAFKAEDALYKLEALHKYRIHSVEQPLKPGAVETEELCRRSPIPIAFDEELIGVGDRTQKEVLLTTLRPAFIVLKPTLHGGFDSCREWIELAEKNSIGWWITSALESNVGLNAICQFTAGYSPSMPQGLGTGLIYTDNIESPLEVNAGYIAFNPAKQWQEL